MHRIAWIALVLAALLWAVSVWGVRPGAQLQPTPIAQAAEPLSARAQLVTTAAESTVEGVPTSGPLLPEQVETRQAIACETVHVRGRVIFPPEGPLDEPVQLIAHATPDESKLTAIAMAEDGTFDAILPCSWHAVGLELHAKSLYLPTANWLYLDSGEQTVELRPECTGQLEVRFILPRGVTDEELAQAEGQVRVDDGHSGSWGWPSRTFQPAKGMSVRFDSLHMTGDVTVTARIAPFCVCAPQKAFLARGECARIDMQLERGASVSGVVVTDTGEPVAGVRVATLNGAMGAPDGGPWAVTDAQGHFQMSGLRSGNDHLYVMKDYGCESRGIGALNVSTLKPGGVCEGVRIVVRP
jgi:hypothetical protein